MYRILILIFLGLGILGCRDKTLEELRGRYQGVLSLGDKTIQVVAEVPEAKEKGQFQTLQISVFETLGTAKPQRVFVQLGDSFLTVQSSFLGNKEYRLSLNSDRCGSAEDPNQSVKLCIATGKIDFEVTNKTSSQIETALHLLRDDTLPPPPKSKERNSFYSLDELVGRARFNSYAVSQDAERVFQAKQRIKMAIGNLLPQFNMKDLLASVSGGPLGAVQTIGSVLPFLFPSNWYKLDEAKELAKAAKKSFASLRGNEIQYVEHTFYLVSRDLAIQKYMEESLTQQKEIHRIIDKKELLGLLPRGSAEKYRLNMLLIEQDLIQLNTLIELEQSSLSHAVALSLESGIKGLLPIDLPNMNTVTNTDARVYVKEAQQKSFEVETFNYLIEASKNNTKSHAWGFLDPNSSDYIGFGYAFMLNVGKSSQRELTNKKEETLSLIEQRAVITVAEHNNSLRAFKIAQEGLNMADERLKRLQRRLQVGDDRVNDEYFVQEMADASSLLLKSKAHYITSIYTLLMAKSKLQRLVLSGFYQDLELTVE